MQVSPPRPRLAVLGTGPKAAALHVLSDAMTRVGVPGPKVTSWDPAPPASHWDGHHGLTDGRCPLGTSPLKDLVFPGRSSFGPEVDNALAASSWVSYLRSEGRLDAWVDRSCPPCSHIDWASYQRWALERVGADARRGRVVFVRPRGEGDGVTVILADGSEHGVDGFVFTGPGRPCRLLPAGDHFGRVMDARDFWSRRAYRPGVLYGRVAIVGCGESAAAMLHRLAPLADDLEVEVITPGGLLPTRDENFPTNTWYSKPAGWADLPLETRRAIIHRGDRGVLSAVAHTALMQSWAVITPVAGRVIGARACPTAVELELDSHRGGSVRRYDFAISAMGFDLLTPLRELLDPSFDLPPDDQLVLGIDANLRLPSGRGNLHVPGLAALAQGPGFPNLSCLGTLAERIMHAY